METHFEVNIPEAIFPRRSLEGVGNASRDVLINSKDYQLLLECLKSENNFHVARKITPLKTVNLLDRHFEASPSQNSHVMVRLSDTEPFVAVTIQSIFSHTRRTITGLPITQNFVKIQPFEPLSPSHLLRDLYRQFPFSGGQLYYNHLLPETKIIPFESIVVHFAQTPMLINGITEECLHVSYPCMSFSLQIQKSWCLACSRYFSCLSFAVLGLQLCVLKYGKQGLSRHGRRFPSTDLFELRRINHCGKNLSEFESTTPDCDSKIRIWIQQFRSVIQQSGFEVQILEFTILDCNSKIRIWIQQSGFEIHTSGV